METYQLIKPLGIITYALLITTVTSGLFRWKLKYHKTLAITTLILASFHGIIVYLNR